MTSLHEMASSIDGKNHFAYSLLVLTFLVSMFFIQTLKIIIEYCY